jgi:hypothetical protein
VDNVALEKAFFRLSHTHLLTTQHFAGTQAEQVIWMAQLSELYTHYSDYVDYIALNGKIRSEL